MKPNAAIIYSGFGHLFAWVWMIGSMSAIYFFVTAIFFDGAWSNFFWGLGASIIGKWLSKGFMDSKVRVIREDKLISEGLTKNEAGQKWMEEYTQTAPAYDQIIRDYAHFLEQNPISNEVRDTKKLPHLKSDILTAIYWNISKTEDKDLIEALRVSALTLAHYQKGVGDEDLTQFGVDLTNIDISNLDSNGLKGIASAISSNPNSERWEKLWTLVESDTTEILAELDNVKQQ